jgi:hypothetical protein
MDAIEELQRRSDAGDAAAMTGYGKVLLAERNFERVREGIGLIQRAAAGDHGEACAQLAALVAGGVAGPPDWERALDLLLRAAERGWREAQTDLRFLAHGEGDNFPALRASVDIRRWQRPPEPLLTREAPRILTCNKFMSHQECARVIARAQPKLRRADVFDPTTGAGMVAQARTNSKAEFSILDWDLPLILLSARISTVLGLGAVHFEPMNVLHYRPGQEFTAHYDFLEDTSPGPAADMRERGQRIVTFLVYLNDDFDGGETVFPRLNYAFKGQTGDAIMFGNVDAKGEADFNTLHAGVAPTRGEKWLLSQWVRDKPQSRPRA